MRITSSMYYKNMYSDNNSKLSKELFDVNKQIASGLQIQYAYDDVRTFTETMRLDNEIATIGQVSKSVESGYKVSTQTDSVLNEFQTTMDRSKSLLIQASNGSQSEASMDAIAAELRGIEEHLINLSNTSIDGKYLFSGSSTDVKPIDENGIYQGNDKALNAFAGNGISQQYNLTGEELFLGEEKLIKKEITSNVPQYNLSSKYPSFIDPTNTQEALIITPNDSIRDLMGDIDETSNSSSHFYLSGTKSDGTTFTEYITMEDSNKVDDLLTQIGNAYGNTSLMDVVNVSMNDFGEIVVQDKLKGSSKLDFHMVGAIDYAATATVDSANINDAIYGGSAGNIDNLKYGETDFDKIINGTTDVANKNLHIKKFVQSPFDETTSYVDPTFVTANYSMSREVASTGAGDDTLTITMDDGSGSTTTYTQVFNTDAQTTYEALKIQVEADGDFTVAIDGDNISFTLTAQGLEKSAFIDTDLDNDDGSATGAVTTTKVDVGATIVSDIESMLYDRVQFSKNGSSLTSNVSQIISETNEFATASTKLSEVADLSSGSSNSLDGESFILSGKTISGNSYNATIDLSSSGSTFSLDGGVNNYIIYDASSPRSSVSADNMTYQQLMDVVNMITTEKLPSTLNSADDYDKAVLDSNSSGNTYLTYDGKISFEDKTSSLTKATMSLYDSNAGNFSNEASVMSFQANNALTISNSKIDFFATFNEIIKSVENHKIYPDNENGDMRNIGIENAIDMIDDLQAHVGRSHASVGAQSNSLQNSLERSQILEISTMTLRSDTIDTDLAEASLTLAQLQLNYQAMLSTVGKVSQLSLVNYL